IRLKELAANGANFVALRSPDALAADILFTLPSGVGTTGQVLTTDGSNPATLSWTNVATTGTSLVGDIGGTIGANTIGAGKVTLSHLSATGTKDATTYLSGDNTWKNFNSGVIAAPLTGLSSAGITKANGTLLASDSITAAFNKLLFTQGDYVSKSIDQTINGTLKINSLTGFIEVPTPLTTNEAANKGYVDSFGQWIKGSGANAADIYFNTGNVGIGTTAPSTNLHVSSSGTDNTSIIVQNTSTGGHSYGLFSTGSTSGAGAGKFAISDNGSPRLSIDSTGNVGIGTTSPGAKLEISGNVKISDGTQAAGRVLTSDASGAASWTGPSYQVASLGLTAGTVVNASNSVFPTSDVTLTQGIWLLNLGYWLNPSATSGCFDVHIDADAPTSGTFTTVGGLPNFNSENAYPAGRHGYLSFTQLINVTSATAAVHARVYHAWCSGATYTISNATLTMIATKVR
ncbi:MAG: hypothetical protein ACXVCE_06255, partial [Bacteriovorax sp.]